jgi:uncharacterized membrane protein
MNLTNLISGPIGLVHLIASLLAMLTGMFVLLTTKGTTQHKKVGYWYAASMLTLNLTAFMIYRLYRKFAIFHWLAVVSCLTLFAGLYPIFGGRAVTTCSAILVLCTGASSGFTLLSWPKPLSDCPAWYSGPTAAPTLFFIKWWVTRSGLPCASGFSASANSSPNGKSSFGWVEGRWRPIAAKKTLKRGSDKLLLRAPLNPFRIKCMKQNQDKEL